QAYADDVVIVFDGDDALHIERRANLILELVGAWGRKNKLLFAPQKTRSMVITNKIKYDAPRLEMGGISIESVDEIKILGLTIDRKLTFNTHVDNTRVRVAQIYKQLSRAARVSWGLHPEVIR
ncbi:hypothetical protein F3H15_37030, partial [Pseudomonas aeruginosa]